MSGKIISVRELLVESFQIKILTILPLPHSSSAANHNYFNEQKNLQIFMKGLLFSCSWLEYKSQKNFLLLRMHCWVIFFRLRSPPGSNIEAVGFLNLSKFLEIHKYRMSPQLSIEHFLISNIFNNH